MRDKRFIAEHRGGPLKKEQHIQLIRWACDCVKHVLPLLGETPDNSIIEALFIAEKWAEGNATAGEARNTALRALALANRCSDYVSIAIARAAGHAVATAHMADHSPGAALYALKAVKNAVRSIDAERRWQKEQLPSEIKELVLSTMNNKKRAFKL
jgi:hypothetical protein